MEPRAVEQDETYFHLEERLEIWGPAPERPCPGCGPHLSDTNLGCRFYAARSLWQITGDPGPVVPVISESLRPKQFGFFPCEAARILGQIGPAATSIVPVLARRARCYQDEIQRFGRRVRGWEENAYPSYFAAEAWWRISHETKAVLPILTEFAL